MRGRVFRRFKQQVHLMRRLKEDRNQHYQNLKCRCWWDPRVIARFREQPQVCSCMDCANQRQHQGAPISERRRVAFMDESQAEVECA